ncbi:phage integrase [Vibrio atypicus]|jgi:site-specific recombinase XerD|uniref:phage integrase n=1 Tax=Vibrio atypicus TaxID=558271 RepID=UPI001356EFA2|nr:tyrosine-type recombinase/integrase [Vibrio atypicus]
MSIQKQGDKYLVDLRPQGRDGKRYRRKFDTKYEANQYEKHILATHHNKEWLERPADKRSLSELIDLWWKYEGQSKKTAPTYKRILKQIDKELGKPKAHQITHKLLSDYRAKHLDENKAMTTFNRKVMCLSNVFTTLIDAQEYHSPHPTKGFKVKRPRAKEMHFLSQGEIDTLLNALSGDALNVAKICLATGARWGEAESLKGCNVVQGRVTFVDTKNGKNRTVPIDVKLEKEFNTGGSGRLFKDCYHDFYSVQKRCEFGLPKGQASHVLRHTFASHFMMNGGNILALQKILGHSTIQQTMTYAHLAPDYLQDAVRFNPLGRSTK